MKKDKEKEKEKRSRRAINYRVDKRYIFILYVLYIV